ncbi:Phenoxybenzoate dioxygenase subunit beta [Marinomonas spartinae]|uniref:PDR/VanB family oxidoreductase n=1 Tax=Marinomonas spartinae TaxID=1792290 RepID=UPI000808E9E9|nr:PDR/VanB family oxidoreductase [Marinomonas spartinae]SBS27610.1 Phenoxybenzoate dioxygenase subunit beta [Marinomonas spartinae]
MIPVVVRNCVEEARNVVRLVLGSQDGSALPPYEAGAHIDLHLPSGLIRQYSLCRMQSDPQYYEIAVLKDSQSRGGSREVHTLNIGDELNISAPRNHFSLAKTKRKALLIAGGIGVTPLLPMAQQLHKMGLPFEFHYCAKSPDTAAFAKALESGSFADKMHFHYSQVPTSGRMDVVNVLSQNAMDGELYVCGPADFITHIIQQAENLGWPDERVHREYFTAPDLAEGDVDNTAFKVKIASTGELLDVAEDQTIFQVLESNGVFVPVSCESGVCGTCQTGVISGTPDHRDVFLTDKEHTEGKLIMPCCSRSKSPVIELDL